MNEPVDPFELLQVLNPIEPDDLHGAASSAQARETLEQILVGTRRQLPAQLPRLRRRVYLLALVPVAAAIAAGAWALSQGATEQLTIGCYASASLQAHTVVVPAGTTSPTATCRAVWQHGDFGAQAPPRLQACVLPSGAIGVFPSPDMRACEQLKLAPLAPTPPAPIPPHPDSDTALKDALVHEFLANSCMNVTRATAVVRAELRRLRLAGWSVQANGTFASARPCASLAFDEERHLVLLVPMPKQP